MNRYFNYKKITEVREGKEMNVCGYIPTSNIYIEENGTNHWLCLKSRTILENEILNAEGMGLFEYFKSNDAIQPIGIAIPNEVIEVVKKKNTSCKNGDTVWVSWIKNDQNEPIISIDKYSSENPIISTK